MKLGVSLAGGGIKGAAHIGVLKALEENNIKIDMISGASSGSIVASLYAMGYKVDEIYSFFGEYAKEIKYMDPSNIVKLILGILNGKGVNILGLTKGKKLEKYIKEKCNTKGIRTMSDIKFPIFVPSVDLRTGDTYIFTNSCAERAKQLQLINDIDVALAVRASCSYPGVFEPVNWENQLFIDGGICENIPWKILKKCGATKVISVVFRENNKKNCAKNMISVIECSIKYINRELLKYELAGGDEIIEINTDRIGLLDHTKVKYLYELGYESALKKIKLFKK